jgi:hypothetical protein
METFGYGMALSGTMLDRLLDHKDLQVPPVTKVSLDLQVPPVRLVHLHLMRQHLQLRQSPVTRGSTLLTEKFMSTTMITG